jgi:predicted phosphoribosyltransferase
MTFKDRAAAGRQLAAALAAYREQRPVVLALPRGGVPVAAEIAASLAAPLDLILVRKIGAPRQPELALGAVVDGHDPIVVRNAAVIAATATDAAAFDRICARELAEVERRHVLYLGRRPPVEVRGHTAIVVDDGVATGATMRAALRAVRQRRPARLVLAVPAASPEALASLRAEADEVVCLASPGNFRAVGDFYDDFRQLTDHDVIAAMAHAQTPADA